MILEEYFKSRNLNPFQQRQLEKELSGEDLLKKHSSGFFSQLIDILDRPGNTTRALLVGKLGGLKGLIPFAQVIENLTGWDIALNKEDRVTGEEVIHKLFGKQKQRKGKLDPVDILGVLVEIAADPLWLVGGAGLTKVGKARSLVGSHLKGIMAAKNVAQADKIADAAKFIKAIHSGNTAGFSGKLAKAMKTVGSAKGPVRLRSLSWAKQVERGERAALNVLGRPVIKGKKAITAAEKFVNKLRTGMAGEKFLSATRRTPLQRAGLHTDIFKPILSEEQYKHAKRLGKFSKAQKLQKDIAKSLGISAEDVGYLATRHAEAAPMKARLDRVVKKAKESRHFVHIEQIEAQRARVISELAEIRKAVNPRWDDFLKVVSEQKTMETLLEEARAAGVNLKEIGEKIGYVPRVWTKEYYKATKPHIFRADAPRTTIQGIHAISSTKPRMDRLSKILRPEINEKIAAKYGAKHMFEPDLLTSLAEGSRQHMNRLASARTIREAVRKYGVKGKREGYVGITDILKKLSEANVPVPTGLPPNASVPMDVANAVFKNFEHLLASDTDRLATNLWEGGQRLLKGSFTVPFPAFHVRNAFSNKVLNWLEGTWKPAAYIDSLKLQKAAYKTRKLMKSTGDEFLDAAKKVDWPDFVIQGKKYKGWEVFDLADRNGIIGRTIGMFDPEEVAGGAFMSPQKGFMGALKGQDPITRTGRLVGTTVEDHDRLAIFIDKLMDGMAPQDAAASVRTALFDYSDLSPFEKKWMRDRLIFFYTFARKNIGQQTRKLFQQPAKQSIWAHLAGGTPGAERRQMYPDYWNERLTIPVGDRVLAGTGLPFEEAFGPLGAPGVGFMDRLRRGTSRGLSRLSPMINTPYELGTGTNIYFNEPIRKYGDWAVQKTPFGRAYGTVRHTMESPDAPGSKVSGFLTGVRYKNFNPADRGKYKIREIARKYLDRSNARTFKRYYTKQPATGLQAVALEHQ